VNEPAISPGGEGTGEAWPSLVTGGAGFIGSNLVDALVAHSGRVTVIDDLSTGRLGHLDGALERGAALVQADVRDAEQVADVMAASQAQTVFHLAGQIDVRRAVAEPAADARINVEGTINVLSAAAQSGVRRVVFVSTGGAIYGEAEVVPTPESAPSRPLSPYGQGKLAAEGYCALFSRLHGLSTVSLRLANVYGPRQDPLGEGGVIAILCGRALSGTRPTVFGDGEQTRDFVHVSDAVGAMLLAAGSSAEGPINVGAGRERTVLDLVDGLRSHAVGAWTPVHEPPRAGEVRRSALDASRAHAVLGWHAQIPLVEGLRHTVEGLMDAAARP